MLAEAKAVGCAVELITNGTRLDEETRRELVRIGLDRLWVSIDGATPESYADVRLWDALPQVTAGPGPAPGGSAWRTAPACPGSASPSWP